jgi:hypothetical protein
MEKDLVLTIQIKDYPKKILATASTRAKYFNPKHKLAQKYLTKIDWPKPTPGLEAKDKAGNLRQLGPEYMWRKEGKNFRLHHTPTRTDVIANPKKVGKEKWIDINGQDIFGQRIHEFTRNKIVNELKKFWKNKIVIPGDFSLKAPQYPVSIHINYKTTIADNADLDNYSLPYHKTLIDSLVEVGLLRNDTIRDIDGIKLTYEPIGKEYLADAILTWGDKIEDIITVKIYANRIQ